MKTLDLSPKHLLPVLLVVSAILELSDGAVSGDASGVNHSIVKIVVLCHMFYCIC